MISGNTVKNTSIRVIDTSFEDDSNDGEEVVVQDSDFTSSEKAIIKSEPMKSTYTFSDPFNVKITAVVDVDNFYCILSSEKPVLDRIQQMLKEEVWKFEMMRKPIPGVLCVVRKDPSNEWMRGIVRKIVGNPEATDTLFEVMSLDYGSIFYVTRFNIRRYIDQVKMKFMEVPPLAMACRLHGLRPRWTGNKTKDERQREISHVLRFGEQASGPDVHMRIVKSTTAMKETSFTPVTVFLPVDGKLESGNITGLLYARGLALPEDV